MNGVGPQKTAYLTLDELTADPKLARRLPPDLAWRCHALPLAEANGRVTVAMANPDDPEARQAVVAALGPRSCVVRGSALIIDAHLAAIWGEEARHPLELQVCASPDPVSGETWDYARAFSELLGARLSYANALAGTDARTKATEFAGCNLLIFDRPDHPLLRRLLQQPAASENPTVPQSQVPFAVLTARRPCWPLERILLVVCGEGADEAAVDWTLRLARPSAAAVTILAVVLPVPAMYQGLARMEQSLAAVLSTDTALGRQMHQVARRLAEDRVDGTLCLRQGAPDQQIIREVVEGAHDLIIMATKPCRWWVRQLRGDPICSLLSQVDRPVLLTEPTTE